MEASPLNLFLVFILVVVTTAGLVSSQVVTTQVIDLAEKARDYFIEATKGNIVGQTTANKFGQNTVVGTSEEDIQSQGGTLIFLQSAEFIGVISSYSTSGVCTCFWGVGCSGNSGNVIATTGCFRSSSCWLMLNSLEYNPTRTEIDRIVKSICMS